MGSINETVLRFNQATKEWRVWDPRVKEWNDKVLSLEQVKALIGN